MMLAASESLGRSERSRDATEATRAPAVGKAPGAVDATEAIDATEIADAERTDATEARDRTDAASSAASSAALSAAPSALASAVSAAPALPVSSGTSFSEDHEGESLLDRSCGAPAGEGSKGRCSSWLPLGVCIAV